MMLILHMGLGPGNRLLSPGLPDHFFASGERIVWISGGCLYSRIGDQVVVQDARTLTGIAYSPGAWAFVHAEPHGYSLKRYCQANDWSEVSIEVTGRQPLTGTDWAVLDVDQERRVIDLASGLDISIPVGARDSRPQPWMTGKGVTWIDGRQVYRFREDDKPRLAGSLPSPPRRWFTGPEGSAIFILEDCNLVVGPRGAPHELPALDADTVRFSNDGTSLVGVGPDGVEWYGIDKQQVIGQRRGRLLPVGFTSEPILLDEDSGVLKTWSGTVLGTGFVPSAVTLYGDRLYGPGGTAWDLSTGERCWKEAPLAATHIVATDGGVIQVGDRIEGFDLEGQAVLNLPLPIDPELDGEIFDVHWVDGFLYFEVEDGWVQVDFDGRRIGESPPPSMPASVGSLAPGWNFEPETGLLSIHGEAVPTAFDGATSTSDGRTLAWSEDGNLYLLCSDL